MNRPKQYIMWNLRNAVTFPPVEYKSMLLRSYAPFAFLHLGCSLALKATQHAAERVGNQAEACVGLN